MRTWVDASVRVNKRPFPVRIFIRNCLHGFFRSCRTKERQEILYSSVSTVISKRTFLYQQRYVLFFFALFNWVISFDPRLPPNKSIVQATVFSYFYWRGEANCNTGNNVGNNVVRGRCAKNKQLTSSVKSLTNLLSNILEEQEVFKRDGELIFSVIHSIAISSFSVKMESLNFVFLFSTLKRILFSEKCSWGMHISTDWFEHWLHFYASITLDRNVIHQKKEVLCESRWR